MRTFSTLTSLLALSSLLVLPGLAHAEKTCTADTDCAKGWTCQVSGAVDCAVPACPPGEKCESQPADCGHAESKSCQPAACHADSDCAEGMVCYTFTSQSCSSSDCAEGRECPEPASNCTSSTQSLCAPRYVLPCTTASDCGSGFRCESTEQCSCSGSAGGSAPSPGTNGSNASAGSASTPPPETSCTCEPSKEKSCHTDPVTCAADSDCLAGWTCVAFVSNPPCASGGFDPAPGAGAQGGATPTPTPDCPAPTETKQCAPPYYALVGDSRGIGHDSLGIPTSGSGTNEGASDGAIPPTANNPGDKGSTAAGDGDSSSSAGCSVTPGARTTGSTLALFGVLGLFSALRRRRAR